MGLGGDLEPIIPKAVVASNSLVHGCSSSFLEEHWRFVGDMSTTKKINKKESRAAGLKRRHSVC